MSAVAPCLRLGLRFSGWGFGGGGIASCAAVSRITKGDGGDTSDARLGTDVLLLWGRSNELSATGAGVDGWTTALLGLGVCGRATASGPVTGSTSESGALGGSLSSMPHCAPGDAFVSSVMSNAVCCFVGTSEGLTVDSGTTYNARVGAAFFSSEA